MRIPYENLAGRRFGMLTAEEPLRMTATGELVWQCRCDCGTVVKIRPLSLRRGTTRSCGCYRVAVSRQSIERTRSP